MATVRDLRAWLADMGDDYTVYVDSVGDICCDNGDARHATYRLYPESDDARHPSWHWANVLAKWSNVTGRSDG